MRNNTHAWYYEYDVYNQPHKIRESDEWYERPHWRFNENWDKNVELWPTRSVLRRLFPEYI